MCLQSEEVLNSVPMNTATHSREALKRELVADALPQFSEARFLALGTSMLPSSYPGECLGPASPPRGDVVLCRQSEGFRVHRIVDVLGGRAVPLYVLRGDALLENDPPVPHSAILGRVNFVLRRGHPADIDSLRGLRHRVLRWMVCRSRVAAVRQIQQAASLPGKSGVARRESA
jgi:hypothetical protein